ncbi:MAG: peptidase T [Lachnospiraceae bacterium]|nr:peptidase T [Lachnospiraceae bacterium]
MNITERFLKYVSFETTSDETSETCPSSPKELELGRFLAEEMKAIGLENARIDGDGYVYGELPASEGCENLPSIGFIAHMDTSDGASGANIRPRILHYEGGDIALSDTVSIDVKTFDFLPNYAGQDLIVTDGTTLLGADDKAGIAEILTAMEYLIAHPEIRHGRIAVGFTPDEEIGRGADRFDIKGFGADWAYTVDGGTLGELEYENFNAASARVTVHGVNVHPGSAKNKMKNSMHIAMEYVSLLPADQRPEHTEGYEGFIHLLGIEGTQTKTDMAFIIRDHDMEKFTAKKILMRAAADYINAKHGEGTLELDIRDSYFNMKQYIEPVMHVVERAKKAYADAGVTPIIQPIRGGTDGSHLSENGLPCPNLSTGGENFHGEREFVSIQAMEKMVEVIVNIVKAE